MQILVVDDGSTDGGADELAGFASAITLVRQENMGEGAARNSGLRAADQPWVAFLDADDYWTPEHLEELACVLHACPQADLVSTRTCPKTRFDASRDSHSHPERRYLDYFAESDRATFISASAAAVRRDTALELGGFGSDQTGADRAFWTKVALNHRIGVSSRVTAVWDNETQGIGVLVRNQRRVEAGMTPDPSGLRGHRSRTPGDFPPSARVALEGLAQGGHAQDPRTLVRFVDRQTAREIRTSLSLGDYDTARYQRRYALSLRNMLRERAFLASFIPEAVFSRGLAVRRRLRGGPAH
jgi:glycosyltransferase involved in cell wall biosynthesis